ncbi:MAG: hypothetical protein LBB98_07325 [Treponema sp.]|jgi:hypothetical protein|nr:hypothetical protein [Treponema sp.]
MENETGVQNPSLRTLVPLADFKAILGLDDREDALSRYCLITATFTIEQYCKRRLFLKKHFERVETNGDLFLPLREYPVREVLAVYIVGAFGETGEPLEPDLYRGLPDLEAETGERPEDTVYSLSLSPALNQDRDFEAIKAVYRAGYGCGEAPADLASACLELAAWNMSRYRGRRVGITGNVRGSGKDGEHLEVSMPENVRGLLEPYQRKTI